MRITSNYPRYLGQYYKYKREVQEENYWSQYASLMKDCYGWADFWTHSLGDLGYEMWEPVGNAQPMQKQWARECGVRFSEKNWIKEIVAAQIQRYKPDVLFVNDYKTYDEKFVNDIKRECPSIKLVVTWCGAPFADITIFAMSDIVLTNIRSFVATFRSLGIRAIHMRHAFCPGVLERIAPKIYLVEKVPFSFVGSVVLSSQYHLGRTRLLAELASSTPLQIWSQISGVSGSNYQARVREVLKNLRAMGNVASTKRLRKEREVREHALQIRSIANKPIYGLDMYRLLANSIITLNTHIDVSKGESTNMRLYEATGVGACLMTEHTEDLKEIFEPDTEVVTYKSHSEAKEKVLYLLDHPEEVKAISAAGQQRTMNDHVFDKRAQQLDEIIRDHMLRYKRHAG